MTGKLLAVCALWMVGSSMLTAAIDVTAVERERVLTAAARLLNEEPLTITAFPSARSAGGAHDYFSEGDYWWPDPKNPDGPYIQRDGMTNPDNFVKHREVLFHFARAVSSLTSAYAITGDERYAAAAVRHLKAWFVAGETKMNPHLLYAQAIKGKVTGRGTGIIDTIHLLDVARAVEILRMSTSLDSASAEAVVSWFRDYITWLTTHQYGIDERDAKNNHGTWWVTQVAAFAHLTGDAALMSWCRDRFKSVLMPDQMAIDGSFPLELKRTKPYNYSLFNLEGFAIICQTLSTPADDLWKYTTPDGRTMKKAMEFLYPYIADKSAWPYAKDVMHFDAFPSRRPMLLFAGLAFNEQKYLDLWQRLDPDPTDAEVQRNIPLTQPLLWTERIASPVIKDQARRQVLPLNADWLYLQDNCAQVRELASSKAGWEKVNLPHSWNVWDAVDAVPGYRRSASWYKKELMIPRCTNELRFILSFEGVNISSEVYVNGVRAGGHVGGYVGFDVDITPSIRQGELNTILVRVTNEYDPNIIPSQKSDFCIYGGITRNVWMKVVPAVFVNDVKIRTTHVSKASASVEADADLRNMTDHVTTVELISTIVDRAGNEIGRRTMEQRLAPGASTVHFPSQLMKHPFLWSPADPALYTVRVQIRRSSAVIDEMTERFGCRWFEIKDHGPFFLNGERLLLRGTHRHEDYAGYANAMPDSLQRKDMKMIRDMGANFVRLAHYPQAPEVYRACDELGILVWDELPWCRGGMGGETWKANTRRLLKEQVVQNFNHPSIIIHSLGNELYWLPDAPDGDNIDSLRAMIGELNGIAHALDPYRLTATRKFTEAADLVDVVSPSIWPGWYSGNYKGYEKAITEAKDKFPRLLHVEYGGDSHFGRHSENPVSGDATTVSDGFEEAIKPQKVKNVSLSSDWSENYIVDLFDWDLHLSEQLPFMTGNAQWAFKDFPTPLRPENPIPYINQKGLVDRAGNPKDAYYVFKSYWTTSPLFCYIESHTWTERSGPAGMQREVNVFSNCAEVELFLNGVSQGRRTRDIKSVPACGLSWQVNFSEGANSVAAIGHTGTMKAPLDSMTVRYSFKKNDVADHIVLSGETLPDGRVLVSAVAVDKDGRRCLDYNKRVYFSWDGPGRLLENYGTPTRSSTIEMANGRAQIEFEPAGAGRAVIEARNQDFKGEYLIIGR